MKFCEITNDNIPAFKAFIPDKLDPIRKDKRSLTWGMFEDNTPMGAVVLFLNNDVLEVRSLEHLDSVEDGVCEKELADFVEKQNWENVYKIEYVVAGADEFLREYDFTMLDIGFFPILGDVRKYSATIEEILSLQKDSIEAFEKSKDKSEFIFGKDLTKYQLDSYNTMYQYNRYFPNDRNKELSCFKIKDGKPVAGITMAEMDDGKIEFQWMDARGQSPQAIMKLIFCAILNGTGRYPKETEVIICPFTHEVESLISRFGFKEVPGNIRTRIYSYYL